MIEIRALRHDPECHKSRAFWKEVSDRRIPPARRGFNSADDACVPLIVARMSREQSMGPNPSLL
jgi:hypothetical protein